MLVIRYWKYFLVFNDEIILLVLVKRVVKSYWKSLGIVVENCDRKNDY